MARERKLKLTLKLNEGWHPSQSQILAQVSVFAADHRIDRARTTTDG
ncbi:hypothetical protein SSAG_06208 [Streptomyces sp. Mg1]|nr:hypothetical protein SSAG_06208 [Streptomyces sp. Mg1]